MKYKILGSQPLSGLVHISGAKNSALKLLVSAILSDGTLEILNVPRVGDVLTFIEILKSLGVSAEFKSDGRLELSASNLNSYKLPEIAKNIKSSILFVGPLLSKFGKASLPKNPKYKRDFHFNVLKSLGAKVTEKDDRIEFECASLHSSEINFSMNTHTGTDNAILSSVFAEGTSVITNAAEEPEIDDLIAFLNKMGAKVSRTEKNPRTVMVEGVRSLGKAEYVVMPDRNETVFYASAAAFTDGSITIKDVNSGHLTSFLSKLSYVGVNYEVISPSEIRVWSDAEKAFNPTNIEVRPYPGFMTDWQPFFSVLLTKAVGESVVTDDIFSRFEFARELNRMGARIEILDSSLKISGPVRLKGTVVEALDVISGAALVMAGLGAKGKTDVQNAELVDSGFENIAEKLQNMGARITRTI